MPKLEELIKKFQSEVPHFVSTDIVNLESGLSEAGGSIDPNFDASVACACYCEVVKSNAQALDLLGLGATTSEDICVSTRDVYLLIRTLGNNHWHGLAITKMGALGYARSIMRKYEPMLLDALREIHGGGDMV
jgi:predicted regulator of Ras-like GTPase activity (Roadblock/LC7/MglB family)